MGLMRQADAARDLMWLVKGVGDSEAGGAYQPSIEGVTPF
jgi:hypothetical protein